MGYLTSWNVTDLSRTVGVTEDQILEWIHEGKLKATRHKSDFIPDTGSYSLELIESIAAGALRDGKDAEEARKRFMEGRLTPFVHTPERKKPSDLHDSADRFRHAHHLPAPERKTWSDGDPRKERE